ncbi:MAG: alpha-galactosidase [Candidatus Latescibacterota bacterium]
MATEPSLQGGWADVQCSAGPEPVVTYRTGLTVYEESLSQGRFVGRGFNGSGFVPYYDGRLDPQQHAAPQAFWLEIDGQLLASDWEWGGCECVEDQRPHAAAPQPYLVHAVVSLRHALRPVTVRVHTGLDGTAVVARWLEVTNTADRPAALSAACPWSGVLQKVNRWRLHLPPGTPLYSLGYMDNTHWGNEGDFQWHDMPNAGYRVDGRYRRDRHRHPMFVLCNNAMGEHFVGQLAWSGGYALEFDLDADQGTTDGAVRIFFRGGPEAPAPQRVLEPGETVRTPQMHLGLVFGDLDAALQAMHEHVRRSVFLAQPRGRGNWIESGIGPEVEITVAAAEHAIDAAAEVGAEVFFIDASWYAPPGGNWWSTVGDWQVDRQRFPEGLEPLRRRAHDHGMLWGLWMDAERLGPESRVARQHPDWIATAYDGQQRLGGLLDLANPEVARWLEEQVARVIGDNELEFFRLDYNVGGLGAGARVERHGYLESTYWRYYEAQYDLYERLRQRFPEVIFENCAGGGGRTDLGQVRRFSHTWVTDWQIAPRSFTITNGMTMALPPEYVDRLLGGQSGYTAAELDFQVRLLLFVRPSIAFLRPPDMPWNPLLKERVRHAMALYKEFVRPMMATGRIYHHTPCFAGPEPQGWGVLELASAERDRALCGVFQLSAPRSPEYGLRPRGLHAGRRYRVTFDNLGQTCELDGFTLMQQGVRVRLEGALTSELLLLEAV